MSIGSSANESMSNISIVRKTAKRNRNELIIDETTHLHFETRSPTFINIHVPRRGMVDIKERFSIKFCLPKFNFSSMDANQNSTLFYGENDLQL